MGVDRSIWRKIPSFCNWLKFQVQRIDRLGLYQEARTRILLWYLAIMLLFISIAIPTIGHRLIAEVNQRVEADLREELEEFEEELIESLLEGRSKANSAEGSEPNNSNIYLAFDRFMVTNKAEDDNYFIAIVDGTFYKTNAPYLPEAIDPNSELMQRWEQITDEEEGEVEFDDSSVDSVIYKAEPIKTTSKTIGVFVVAHISAGERAEVLSSISIVIQILFLTILLAFAFGWVAAGKVLSPLKDLSDTAKSISESDLSGRIATQGKGEIAQLGNTFNAMMDRIEVAFDTQRNFINDIGQELRTPITIVRGHLELMDSDPQSQQETLDLVIDELNRMDRMVEDLVLLAKAERPDFLQIETIELTSFVAELFSKLERLGERNWHLDTTIASGRMTGDRQRITQAIVNLANNAVQHTVTDSLIVFGAKMEGNRVEFWLRDTGNGIAIAEQQRIFDRFTRVKNARRHSEGSGLGLAIVKTVVEAHGGAITLQSKLGIGSTFTLIFPLEFNEKRSLL